MRFKNCPLRCTNRMYDFCNYWLFVGAVRSYLLVYGSKFLNTNPALAAEPRNVYRHVTE
jgi:hypothetical protein